MAASDSPAGPQDSLVAGGKRRDCRYLGDCRSGEFVDGELLLVSPWLGSSSTLEQMK